jgi:hypothetical protein
MRSNVWEKQCALELILLPHPSAELVHTTTHPVVSSIVDVRISQPSFKNRKLLFFDDALFVGKLLKGGVEFATWTSQVTQYATLTRL